ncbi:ABP1 [Candida oxycetoniae]|uniref:ABP1 n=1 Tax=Candida oxycetoniae TaxID=497107 RepID=A0AAI9SUF4_9ASCO|nr:ABP1 [Candida oxycetoniae]KAI3402714.2 ABP1 [Candida oxycetoniae]
MEKIDFSTNSKRIQESYNKVVRGDPNFSYVVYLVNKNSTLDVAESGDGSLDEFVSNFADGQIQFGLARVTVPGSDVSKIILLGWCPDNAPAKSRLSFANNFAEVSKIFNGYHIQITAREQDDLDVDEFLNRVASAAGARYSTVKSGASTSSAKAGPPPASKPFVSKAPALASSSKQNLFAPKSTGRPVHSVVSSSKPKPKLWAKNDGWGDAQDVEERDFEKSPLEDVPSAYKPTKVNIDELRKQKSDTVSSTPRASANSGTRDKHEEDTTDLKPLSERMKTYDHHDDGRLTSLPKPKVGNSVANKYKANANVNANTASGKATFGAKPTFGTNDSFKSDKVVGGLSRNFGAENGKTPAQIWAEKHGKYKTVDSAEERVDSFENQEAKDKPITHASELAAKFEKQAKIEDDEEEEEPPKPLPRRNLASSFATRHEEDDEDEEEEEEEPPKPLPRRNLASSFATRHEEDDEDEEEEEEEPPKPLPARNLPSRTPVQSTTNKEEEDNAPKLPQRSLPPRQNFDDDEDEEEDDDDEKPARLPARNLPLPPQRQAEPEPEPEPELEPEQQQQEEEEDKAGVSTKGHTATAEYDYVKDEDNEIGFEEGDIIIEIDFVDEDWWSGKLEKTGEVGLFPANYVSLHEERF